MLNKLFFLFIFTLNSFASCYENPLNKVLEVCLVNKNLKISLSKDWFKDLELDNIEKEVLASKRQSKDIFIMQQMAHAIPYLGWYQDYDYLEKENYLNSISTREKKMYPGSDGAWPSDKVRFRQDYYFNQLAELKSKPLKERLIFHLKTKIGSCSLEQEMPDSFSLSCHKIQQTLIAKTTNSNLEINLPVQVLEFGLGVVSKNLGLIDYYPKENQDIIRNWRLLKTALVLDTISI